MGIIGKLASAASKVGKPTAEMLEAAAKAKAAKEILAELAASGGSVGKLKKTKEIKDIRAITEESKEIPKGFEKKDFAKDKKHQTWETNSGTEVSIPTFEESNQAFGRGLNKWIKDMSDEHDVRKATEKAAKRKKP